jgi:hypothetical protein
LVFEPGFFSRASVLLSAFCTTLLLTIFFVNLPKLRKKI